MAKFKIFPTLLLLILAGCELSDPSSASMKHTYYFSPNVSYNGVNPITGASMEISGFNGGIASIARVTLSGTTPGKKYPVHIHKHNYATDSFSTEIAYGLGDHLAKDTFVQFTKEIPVNIRFFLQDFKGHFLVHDPDFFSNIDTMLLIAAPTGNSH